MEISRRTFLGAGAATAAVRVASRPHILLLMADQFRADCIAAAGNSAIRTPNLDRIANEGARFTCAYSSTPTCTPARSALLTGLAPWNHGMLRYGAMAERYPVEKPRLLREAGYYTSGIGKMHYNPQRNGHGFHQLLLDESGRVESPHFRSDYRSWFWSEAPALDPDATGIGWNDYPARPYALPERLHPTRWTGDTAVRFIEGYNRREPFFLKVSFARPHSPYDPPERFWHHYAHAALPAAFQSPWSARFAPRSGPADDIWHGDLGSAQVRRSRQGYYASVSFVDEQVGRVLQALERRGWLEETLILFTADHGDMLGDHNLWRKSYAYESSAHIPFLVRWPGRRGIVVSQPVELRDVLPTFAEAAGIEAPQGVDGRSVLPLVAGRKEGWRPWIDLEHGACYSPDNCWNALADREWKYVFHARDAREQLFHTAQDPAERSDLASDPAHADTLRTWRARLAEHLAPRGEHWVRNGRLVARAEDPAYSPRFPR